MGYLATTAALLLMMSRALHALTIDSQIAAVTNDCYERVAIGQRIPDADVTTTTPLQLVKECERLCNKALDECGAFSFGISSKGNGTCLLARRLPPRGTLKEDPDYDSYLKKEECRVLPPPSYPDTPTGSPAPGLPPRPSTCFRRLFAGKRLSEHLVRSSFPALTVEGCQQKCSSEKHFTCEGFNYRFDVGGHGRGSCELVSIPSSRLDLVQDFYPDRDHDYYERDRNGPPNCNPLGDRPTTSPGWPQRPPPGGPPVDRDRYGHWGDGGYNPWTYAPYHPPHGGGTGGGWYPPIKRGDNVERWDRPSTAWGPPGGGGGVSREPPVAWRPPPQTRPPPPYVGGGDFSHGPSFTQQECFVRARAGFRLDRASVKVSHAVPSLFDCELECAQERRFVCLTFSFRYSLQPSYPQDNCLLSGRAFPELDSYTDILQDRDYDVYVRNERARACAVDSPPPFRPDAHGSECFRRVRSGQRLDRTVVRDSISTQSVVECELECLRSRYFTCRIFSFRYGSAVIGGPLDNCLLSDWPLSELEPIRHLQDDLSFELYERGSFGHGCELDRPPYVPLLPPPVVGREPPPPSRPKPDVDPCYMGYGKPARLLNQVIKSSLFVPNEELCKAECSRARNSFLFYCAAFSFRARTTPHDETHNCLLTDIEQRDLQPGVDYVYEADHWLFAFNSKDPRCEPRGTEVHPVASYVEHYPERDYSTTWKHFTVSGRPCRYGTECTENREAGFWSCELEGGDAGDFDYCCRPAHQCGYSEGYSYPWCYVGIASRDQWRPCSDRYYPYSPHGGHRPDHGYDQGHGQGHGYGYGHGHGPAPSQGGYGGYHGGQGGGYDGYNGYERYPSGPGGGYGVPSGGYGGPGGGYGGSSGPNGPPGGHSGHDDHQYHEYGPPRYWPVAYLHHEAPPNSSYISSPGDKGMSYGRPVPHVDVGFDNYVDAYRSGYGKNMVIYDPRNNINNETSRKSAERNFILGVSLTSKQNDRNFKPVPVIPEIKDTPPKPIEKVPSFQVVDQKDDPSSAEVNTEGREKDNVDSSSEMPLLTKLQPRFVQPRGESKVTRSVMRDNKAWRWTLAEDELTPVKTVILPVEFRRKSSQSESFVTEDESKPESVKQ